MTVSPTYRVVSFAGALLGALLAPVRVTAQRVLTVIAHDTALEAAPTVPAGLTTIRLVLQGKKRRELVVHRIPAGTTIESLVRGAAGRSTRWFERLSLGGPAVPPNPMTEATVTLDLRPGRFALVAYEVDGAGRPKGGRFLSREFTAIASAVLIASRFPVPDATIKVKDTRIVVSGAVRPGRRTLQVENTGARPHELIIGRLLAGKTLDDVRRWNPNGNGAAPFVYVGGVTPMSPGAEAQTELVLQRGVHVVLCPMQETGLKGRDYERGALASFNVN